MNELFVVTGASGSGKTTLTAPLAERLRGRCVTFDVDCILQGTKQIAGPTPVDWDAFREMWLCIAAAVAQSGVTAVLLGPFIAQHLDDLPSRSRFGEIHYFALDCDDEVRRERLRARPYVQHDLEQQVEFGQHIRTIVADKIDTSVRTPEESVEAVAAWVRNHLGR